MSRPVIFDTDAGTDVDDLYALALILAHPELELLGVTTCDGDTAARARLVTKMLRLAGREDVPVFAGPRCPLRLTGTPGGAEYRQKLTHTRLVEAGDPESGAEYGDAVGFVLETLGAAEKPVTIICTGPMTNLGELLHRASAEHRSRIASLALMGGEVHSERTEHNVEVDPEAAAVVLGSGLPIFLGTWSVTRELFFTMEEVDRLIGVAPPPLLRALHAGTRMWWRSGIRGKPGPVCYDVVPVFWAAGERAGISCVRLDAVDVELGEGPLRGRTVSRNPVAEAKPISETVPDCLAVSSALDSAALKKRYIELVFG